MSPGQAPLAGVGVLVTRPVHQAGPLCEALERRGARVTRLPMIDIRPTDDTAGLERGLARLSAADLAIFVSPNAVEGLLHELSARGLSWPPGITVAAVGHGTVRALEAHGMAVDVVPASGFDSESLLDMPALRQIAGHHAILIRGNGGRDVLRGTMEERGARVTLLPVYRRALPDLPVAALDGLGRPGEMDVAVITSGTVLEHLVTVAGPQRRDALLDTGLVVISGRVAAQASGLGFRNGIVTADDPGAEALADGVVRWVADNRRQDNP